MSAFSPFRTTPRIDASMLSNSSFIRLRRLRATSPTWYTSKVPPIFLDRILASVASRTGGVSKTTISYSSRNFSINSPILVEPSNSAAFGGMVPLVRRFRFSIHVVIIASSSPIPATMISWTVFMTSSGS